MVQDWCATGCFWTNEMCNLTFVHSCGVWELSTVKSLVCVLSEFSNHFTKLSSKLLINYIIGIAKRLASIVMFCVINNHQLLFLGACFLPVEIPMGNFSAVTKTASNYKCLKCYQQTLATAGTSLLCKSFDSLQEEPGSALLAAPIPAMVELCGST